MRIYKHNTCWVTCLVLRCVELWRRVSCAHSLPRVSEASDASNIGTQFIFTNRRIFFFQTSGFFFTSNRITHVFTICWENSHRKKNHDPSDCSYLRIHATAPLHFIQYDQRKLHLSVLIRSYYIQKCSTARETIFPPKIFPKTTKHVHSQTKLVDWSACLRTVASLLKIGSESCWVV